jgi:hypothetical protein
LNFNLRKLLKAADYMHQHNKKLHVALNAVAHPGAEHHWQQAIDAQIFARLPFFRQQLIASQNHPLKGIQQCNGYRHRIAVCRSHQMSINHAI